MARTVATHVPGLDEALCGGLREGACVLVEGVPGTGKTTLGLQFVYTGAQRDEPGLVITFEQFADQIYEDALSFGWDLQALERANMLRVVPTSPDVLLQQLSETDSPLSQAILELRVQRVVIDSVSHLAQLTDDMAALRQHVYGLRNALRRLELTALLTKELDSAAVDVVPFEEYLVDTVIRLTYEVGPDRRRRRHLEVVKSRGQDHVAGKHGLVLGASGARIYPRHQPRPVAELVPAEVPPPERLATGVEGLDQMLGGGLPRGATLLVAGSAGVGKTSLAVQFLAAGAAVAERGLLVSFEERPAKVVRLAAGYGIDLEALSEQKLLRVRHYSPLALDAERLVCELKEQLAAFEPARVVVDGLVDLQLAFVEPTVTAATIRAIVECLEDRGVTAVLTTEIPELFGHGQVTDKHVSVLVDGIVLMKYLELESEVQRALSVLKMRGSDHDKSIRRYTIDSGGIRVATRFEGAEGVLAGMPRTVNVNLSAYSLSEVDEQVNAELVERFTHLHPTVTTVPLRLPYNPDDVLHMVTGALAGPSRHLSVVPLCLYWMPDVIDSGALSPLNDLLSPEERAEFLPYFIEPALREDRLYAVPSIALCGVLLYRRDLLEKYGFEPPKTWDDLVQQAQTIVAGERRDDLIGYQFPGYRYEGLTCTFLENLWSNGGELWDEADGFKLDSTAALEAAQHLHDLIHRYQITPPSVTTLAGGMANHADFVAGRTVFLTLLPNVMQIVNQPDCPVRGRVGLAPPPRGPSGTTSHSFLGGWHYAVPKSARAPQAARAFIRFMTGAETQKSKALGGGPLPTLEALYHEAEILARNPYYPELRALLERSKHRHEIPRYLEVSKVLQVHLGELLEGSRRPAEALEAAAVDLAAISPRDQ